jgi:hypothetical protein
MKQQKNALCLCFYVCALFLDIIKETAKGEEKEHVYS